MEDPLLAPVRDHGRSQPQQPGWTWLKFTFWAYFLLSVGQIVPSLLLLATALVVPTVLEEPGLWEDKLKDQDIWLVAWVAGGAVMAVFVLLQVITGLAVAVGAMGLINAEFVVNDKARRLTRVCPLLLVGNAPVVLLSTLSPSVGFFIGDFSIPEAILAAWNLCSYVLLVVIYRKARANAPARKGEWWEAFYLYEFLFGSTLQLCISHIVAGMAHPMDDIAWDAHAYVMVVAVSMAWIVSVANSCYGIVMAIGLLFSNTDHLSLRWLKGAHDQAATNFWVLLVGGPLLFLSNAARLYFDGKPLNDDGSLWVAGRQPLVTVVLLLTVRHAVVQLLKRGPKQPADVVADKAGNIAGGGVGSGGDVIQSSQREGKKESVDEGSAGPSTGSRRDR